MHTGHKPRVPPSWASMNAPPCHDALLLTAGLNPVRLFGIATQMTITSVVKLGIVLEVASTADAPATLALQQGLLAARCLPAGCMAAIICFVYACSTIQMPHSYTLLLHAPACAAPAPKSCVCSCRQCVRSSHSSAWPARSTIRPPCLCHLSMLLPLLCRQ